MRVDNKLFNIKFASIFDKGVNNTKLHGCTYDFNLTVLVKIDLRKANRNTVRKVGYISVFPVVFTHALDTTIKLACQMVGCFFYCIWYIHAAKIQKNPQLPNKVADFLSFSYQIYSTLVKRWQNTFCYTLVNFNRFYNFFMVMIRVCLSQVETVEVFAFKPL